VKSVCILPYVVDMQKAESQISIGCLNIQQYDTLGKYLVYGN